MTHANNVGRVLQQLASENHVVFYLELTKASDHRHVFTIPNPEPFWLRRASVLAKGRHSTWYTNSTCSNPDIQVIAQIILTK